MLADSMKVSQGQFRVTKARSRKAVAQVARRNPRRIELRRGLFISLGLAIGILAVEFATRELFISGFVIIALLVSAATFGVAGNLASNRS